MHASIFEAIMLICFGFAWPTSIYKSYTSRRNDGKSLYFMVIVFIGYIAGIIYQILIAPHTHYMFYLFAINLTMVGIDIVLYFRNGKIMRRS